MSSSLKLNLNITGATSASYRGSPGISRLLGTSKLNLSVDDDAVITSLKKTSRKDNQALVAQAEKSSDPQSSGQVFSLLKRLSEITSQLKDLKKELGTGTLIGDAKKALEDEIKNLSTEFSSITSSDDYKQLLEISQGITGALASGTSTTALAKSLKRYRGLLGDNILGLAQSGDLYRLGQFSGSLNGMATLDLSNVLTDDSVLENASSFLRTALKSLSGAEYQETTAQTESAQAQIKTVEAPEQQDLIFQGAGKIALTLRSYPPEELLKAAMNGLDIEAAGELILTIPKEKDEEKQRKDEIERRDALRHV
ncbi:MAG: hypothetical protein K1X83_08345, partial [Oligoflexia bacterium]|nr:hypothetical protein [Oligoflexia bacterium]